MITCVLNNFILLAAADPVLAFRWGGETGTNGEPALNVQLKTWGNVQNDHWSQTNVSFRSSDWRLGLASDNPYALETFLFNELHSATSTCWVALRAGRGWGCAISSDSSVLRISCARGATPW